MAKIYIYKVNSCRDCPNARLISHYGEPQNRFCIEACKEINEEIKLKTFHADCPLKDE